jgi:hypothetical protein
MKSNVTRTSHSHPLRIADLDVVARAEIRTIACLIEPHELIDWQISDLPSAAVARNIEFLHRPIRDVSVPTVDAARSLIGELTARRDTRTEALRD